MQLTATPLAFALSVGLLVLFFLLNYASGETSLYEEVLAESFARLTFLSLMVIGFAATALPAALMLFMAYLKGR